MNRNLSTAEAEALIESYQRELARLAHALDAVYNHNAASAAAVNMNYSGTHSPLTQEAVRKFPRAK